jgi:hypothetical protein
MIKLVCKRVTFYSQNDETAFFEFLDRIKAISKWEGVGDEVHLYLPRVMISNTSLRDLLAVFYRYKIDMVQLQPLIINRKEERYKNKKAFWYKRVFGKS